VENAYIHRVSLIAAAFSTRRRMDGFLIDFPGELSLPVRPTNWRSNARTQNPGEQLGGAANLKVNPTGEAGNFYFPPGLGTIGENLWAKMVCLEPADTSVCCCAAQASIMPLLRPRSK
jgi:hypothetical protein